MLNYKQIVNLSIAHKIDTFRYDANQRQQALMVNFLQKLFIQNVFIYIIEATKLFTIIYTLTPTRTGVKQTVCVHFFHTSSSRARVRVRVRVPNPCLAVLAKGS